MFQSHLQSRGQSLSPLDTITADLMGKFDEAAPHNGSYALTIRDSGSSYGECHIITRKSDSSTILFHVLATWETKTGKKVKSFCSYNGGEFCNNAIEAWYQLCGITHEKSLPYYHKQNGSIEHYNQSIADMGRTFLHESGLPMQFWGFAFMWAAHLQNLLPNSCTGRNTPIELFLNKEPCYNQIQLFGKLAYVHIPREKRQKINCRAVEGCVMMFLNNSKG
ncbi:hypothetical protein O181_013167 [Austropuccinia psidii MF-1]|uniref:Integrase catalytic domain-containing protein n=1 Tax=Austropuccinia psidii MF-1 TaxID=1389203 RepID=A0A9Q3BXS4_9BASI|nr:hypothetical protein [Austropuccinia psidii MF-1]